MCSRNSYGSIMKKYVKKNWKKIYSNSIWIGITNSDKERKSVINWRNKKCDNNRLLSATGLESVMVQGYRRPFTFMFINKTTQPFSNHFTIWLPGHINFILKISATSAVFLPAFP